MMALELCNVSISYDRVQAVRDVSLRVWPGIIATIIGANGAGKSTILNAISGLRPLRAGTILVDSEDIASLSPDARVRLGIAQVPEGRRLFGRMTVGENIQIGAYTRSDAAEARRNLETALELFPVLKARLKQLAGTLSGGEQQMVAIARAMMSAPRLLLLDEPSMGLAPQLVDVVFEAIQAINKTGVTILLVEQNAYRALEMAEQGFVLETGELTLTDTGAALLEDPRVQSAYLGS